MRRARIDLRTLRDPGAVSVLEGWTAPGNLEALACRIRLCYQGSLLIVVVFLEFFRWNVGAGGVEPLVVVPGDPFHRGEGDIPDAIPRPVAVDELFLVETI